MNSLGFGYFVFLMRYTNSLIWCLDPKTFSLTDLFISFINYLIIAGNQCSSGSTSNSLATVLATLANPKSPSAISTSAP